MVKLAVIWFSDVWNSRYRKRHFDKGRAAISPFYQTCGVRTSCLGVSTIKLFFGCSDRFGGCSFRSKKAADKSCRNRKIFSECFIMKVCRKFLSANFCRQIFSEHPTNLSEDPKKSFIVLAPGRQFYQTFLFPYYRKMFMKIRKDQRICMLYSQSPYTGHP